MSRVTIHPERPDDSAEVRTVVEAAFSSSPLGHQGEADLVERLRNSCPDVLSLVAKHEDHVIGHVMFSPAKRSCGLSGVREAARKDSKLRFTNLLHHVNEDCLTEAFFNLKKTAAVGVNGVTWDEYERNMEANIADLHDRIHRGAYRAKPSRRIWIPKPDGRQRPLGIAALKVSSKRRTTRPG